MQNADVQIKMAGFFVCCDVNSVKNIKLNKNSKILTSISNANMSCLSA